MEKSQLKIRRKGRHYKAKLKKKKKEKTYASKNVIREMIIQVVAKTCTSETR